MRRGKCWLAFLLPFACVWANEPQTNPTDAAAQQGITRGVKPGEGFPSVEEFYPLGAKRRGETGAVDVRACVDTRGELTAPPTLVHTSKNAQLDRAALALATAGSGHYSPAMENGQLVAKCFVFRIRFGPSG
jgi:TonB family protein